LHAGSAVEQRVQKGNLVAHTLEGVYVSIVPPCVGHCLAILIERGREPLQRRKQGLHCWHHPAGHAPGTIPTPIASFHDIDSVGRDATDLETAYTQNPSADRDLRDEPESVVVKPMAGAPANPENASA
jgi:hypothetical protein